jgi:F-type H+-transporting ATPase subunit a
MTTLNNTVFIIISNPLEQFEIRDFFYVSGPLLGEKFSLTNIGLYLILVTFIILGMSYLSLNNSKVVPSRWALVQESLFGSILNVVNSSIGKKGQVYLPFLFTIFIYVLLSNLIGLVPYSFTPSSHFVFGIGFSVAILIGVTILGLQTHALKFFGLFVPAGTPLGLVPVLVLIETISYVARALSLGLRLTANMIGGHVLLKIFSTFTWKAVTGGPILLIVSVLPFAFIVAFTGLEIAIAFIQAYVFTMLTASYLNDAINLH